MRQIIALITAILMLCFVTSSLATEAKKPEKTYSVTINITYNAVTKEEAANLVAGILVDHSKACELNVKIGASRSNVVTWSTPNQIFVPTPGDIILTPN